MIRIGIIGYGYWGPNLVRNFAEMRGAEAAGVADVDRTKLESVQRRFPAVKVTTDFRSVYGTLLERVLDTEAGRVLDGSRPALDFL